MRVHVGKLRDGVRRVVVVPARRARTPAVQFNCRDLDTIRQELEAVIGQVVRAEGPQPVRQPLE